jgi:hypothetical protein
LRAAKLDRASDLPRAPTILTERREALRGILLAAVVLGAFAAAATVQAEPVQEFSFELRDVKPDGRFTVLYTQRSYDTTGAVPTQPNEFHLRLPAGAKLRKQFLSKRVFCDVKKLDKTRNPKSCRRSQVGTGRVLVDARPFITDQIPADLWLFLAKGTVRKAVASLAILGKQDQSAPVVRDIPVVRDFRAPIVYLNFFDEPTKDGTYGYKLAFGNSPTSGGTASFSIAETRVVNRGFTLTKRRSTCLERRGRTCARRKVEKKRLFWFTPPRCPASGKVSFEAFFGYQSLPDIVRTTELPCPRFRR